MIYIASQEGVQKNEIDKLIDLAKISLEDQASIINLKHLGVSLLKKIDKKNTKKSKDKKQKPREDSPPYELSRYIPELKSIAEVYLFY
jgi:hypothetical protein